METDIGLADEHGAHILLGIGLYSGETACDLTERYSRVMFLLTSDETSGGLQIKEWLEKKVQFSGKRENRMTEKQDR